MRTTIVILIGMLFQPIIIAQNILSTDGLKLSLDEDLSILSIHGDMEYLADVKPAYLLNIKSGDQIMYPITSRWNESELSIDFSDDIQLVLLCTEQENYLKFQVKDIKGEELIEALFYGPIPLAIDETVGEIVGVVREKGYAIGLQSLNAKTTGGKLSKPDGSDSARGTTASIESYGSSLQAYCINRNKNRTYNIWNDKIPNAFVPANKDGKLVGSAIALFGCKEENVLNVIEGIELAEGLPYSTVNGVWAKRSPDANRPYLITTFTEASIDECLEITKKLGYQALYHSHPFASWGHFDLLEDQFPNGWDSMKSCVEKAKEAGIRLGVHTLTNFITTNDSFVSPVPHKDLMTYCESEIARNLTSDDTEIYITVTDGYDHKDDNQALIIGNEIIRFSGISDKAPFKLLNCKRGQYNTTVASYPGGTKIARLVDHPYKVFFPNWDMQNELIDQLADFFNYTGVAQLDFDGHEGGWGTGEGEFGMDYFSEQLQKKVKHELRNGSSRSNHFYWHTVSYINWGEPWYGGFTKSQGHYRYKNQALLDRNYIPNMLGWFLLNSNTTLQEFEYMLARSAGFDAGYALTGEIKNFKANPEFDQILSAINTWEEARLKKIFNKMQIVDLQDVNRDFSLSKVDDEHFDLQYYSKLKFELLNQAVQPGQPNDVRIDFEANETEALYFVIGAVGESGMITKIQIEINGYQTYSIETDLEPNWAITYRGDDKVLVYDEVGRFKKKIDLGAENILLSSGLNSLRLSAEFSDGADIALNAYVRLKDKLVKIIY